MFRQFLLLATVALQAPAMADCSGGDYSPPPPPPKPRHEKPNTEPPGPERLGSRGGKDSSEDSNLRLEAYASIRNDQAARLLTQGSPRGLVVLDGAWPRIDVRLARIDPSIPLVQGPGYRAYDGNPGGLLIEAPPRAEVRDALGNVVEVLEGHRAHASLIVRALSELPLLSAAFLAAQGPALAQAKAQLADGRIQPAMGTLVRLRAIRGMPLIAEEATALHDELLAAGQRRLADAQATVGSDAALARRLLTALHNDYADTEVGQRAAALLAGIGGS